MLIFQGQFQLKSPLEMFNGIRKMRRKAKKRPGGSGAVVDRVIWLRADSWSR